MPLPEYCGYTPLQRYFWTIGRKTHRVPDESGHIILQQYIDGLAAQDLDNGLAACRDYLDSVADVDKLSTVFALYNFGSGAFRAVVLFCINHIFYSGSVS